MSEIELEWKEPPNESQTQMLKYKLMDPDFFGISEVEIPESAKIMHVDLQLSDYGSGVMAWAEVESTRFPRKRKFTLIATGEAVPERGVYMKTFIYPSGTVWHLYQLY